MLLLYRFAVQKAQYIQFIENKGQWNSSVTYAGELNGGGFFLQKNGYRVLLNKADDWKKIADYYSPTTKILPLLRLQKHKRRNLLLLINPEGAAMVAATTKSLC